ncbi:MAG: hypothetical protein ACLQVL_33210, partial [Terriglobia bacterium]
MPAGAKLTFSPLPRYHALSEAAERSLPDPEFSAPFAGRLGVNAMRILLTGSSGLIGHALLTSLAADGHT